MSVSSLKLASAVIGVGGVATGTGLGIYQLVKTSEKNKEGSKETEKLPETKTEKKKISTLLREKNKSILAKTGNDNKWKKNWEKFKEDYAANAINKESWKFEGTDNLASLATVTDHFKNKCEGTKELENSEDNKFLNEVILYCTDNGAAAR